MHRAIHKLNHKISHCKQIRVPPVTGQDKLINTYIGTYSNHSTFVLRTQLVNQSVSSSFISTGVVVHWMRKLWIFNEKLTFAWDKVHLFPPVRTQAEHLAVNANFGIFPCFRYVCCSAHTHSGRRPDKNLKNWCSYFRYLLNISHTYSLNNVFFKSLEHWMK